MNKKHLGVLYIIVSAFCFALMNTFVRLPEIFLQYRKAFSEILSLSFLQLLF